MGVLLVTVTIKRHNVASCTRTPVVGRRTRGVCMPRTGRRLPDYRRTQTASNCLATVGGRSVSDVTPASCDMADCNAYRRCRPNSSRRRSSSSSSRTSYGADGQEFHLHAALHRQHAAELATGCVRTCVRSLAAGERLLTLR